MTVEDGVGDGPWRVAPQFRLAVLADVGDLGAAAAAARLGASFTAAGLPLADARAAPPGTLRQLLDRSAALGLDVLVVDAHTVIDPTAVVDLRRTAAGDPMIVAAMPRFSDAPLPGGGVAYALVPDRRGLYVKASVWADFADRHVPDGDGDDVVGGLLALNRLGFRVAVSLGTTAIHPDGLSPRGPLPAGWRAATARHLSSAPHLAEALLEGLRPGADGRRSIAFDLSHAGPHHSGTTGLARALVRRAAARWTDLAIHVVARADTFASHFAGLDGVTRADPAGHDVFAALIRVGQPFLWGEIDAAARRAPVLVLFMLDTIGLDCQRDAPDELDALWRFCLAEADGLLFNSVFTERQFARRFSVRPGMPRRISLHSLDVADYRLADIPDAAADGGVLVIGNAMPHKYLRETSALLAGAGLPRPVTVLGLPDGAVPGIDAIPSGAVTPERMAALHVAARIVVYPSVYEGFGFPILDALAHRRPILVRDLAPYGEIAAGLPERANIHRFTDDADLVRRLADPPAWTEERAPVTPWTWDDAAVDLRTVLDAALAGADRDRVIRRIDMLRGRMSFMRARALGGGTESEGSDEVERLAGLVGRLAQGAVLWLGRCVPGLRGLAGAAHRALATLRR